MNLKNKNKNKELDRLAILPISAIANALGVHQRTLRIYDKEGILSPSRSEKNRRHYTLVDLEKAKAILFLTRNLALNLSGVKIILALLKENEIPEDEYLDFIKKMAKIAKINTEIQEVNIKKTSSRGRKKAQN